MKVKIQKTVVLHLAIERSLIPLCICTIDHKIAYSNAAFETLFPAAAHTSGAIFQSVLKEAGLYTDDFSLLDTLEEGSRHEIVKLRFRDALGNKRKLDVHFSLIPSENEVFMLFQFEDVTERIAARDTIRTFTNGLQMAADINQLGIFEFNFRNQQLLINRQLAKITGWTDADPARVSSFVRDHLIHPDFDTLSEAFFGMLQSGEKIERILHLRDVLLGERYWKIALQCLHDSHHEPWRLIGTVQDHTAIMLQQEEVQRQRDLLQHIIDVQSNYVVRFRKDGKIVFANQAFRSAFPFGAEHLPYIQEILSASAWESLHQSMREIIKTPQASIQGKLIHTDAQQQAKHVEFDLLTIYNMDADTLELQLFGRDTTLQDSLSREIHHVHGNIQSLINNFNTVSIWSIDRQMRLTACNEHFNRMSQLFWGITLEIGDSIETLKSAMCQGLDFWEAQFIRCFSGEAFSVSREVGGMAFDISFNPIIIEGEINGVACYSMDVSHLKRTENRLKLSEERWKFAVEGNRYGIWDWDAVEDVIYFSPSCNEILGYSADAAFHSSARAWAAELHPDEIKEISLQFNRIADGLDPSFSVEMRIKTHDGSYKWIHNRGRIYSHTPDGKAARVLGIWQDISKEKADEARINQYVKNLEHFASLTSHELRHPVANILGIAEQLKDNSLEREEIQLLVHQLNQASQRMDTVIREMNAHVSRQSNTNSHYNPHTESPSLTNESTRVWLIDDDVINNILNERLMKKHYPNIPCKTFINAEEALMLLENEPSVQPDIIFLDINMPGMNGWDFLDALHQISKQIPVYMLSSSIDPSDHEKAGQYAMVREFISKPLREENLRKIFPDTV